MNTPALFAFFDGLASHIQRRGNGSTRPAFRRFGASFSGKILFSGELARMGLRVRRPRNVTATLPLPLQNCLRAPRKFFTKRNQQSKLSFSGTQLACPINTEKRKEVSAFPVVKCGVLGLAANEAMQFAGLDKLRADVADFGVQQPGAFLASLFQNV